MNPLSYLTGGLDPSIFSGINIHSLDGLFGTGLGGGSISSLGNINTAGLAGLGTIGGKGGGLSAETLALLGGGIAGSTPVPYLNDVIYNKYTPENIQYAGDVNYNNIADRKGLNIITDPRLSANQYSTLSELDRLSQSGMNDIDKARLNDIMSQQQQVDKGNRDAILQGAKQRGLFGSGIELASLLQSGQDSSNQANKNSLSVNAMAQERALQALIDKGNLSSSMQNDQFNQKFGVESEKAQAQDLINRFNTENQNSAISRNMETKQSLNNLNTGNRQDLSNQNVGLLNQAMDYNLTQKPLTTYGMLSGNNAAIGTGISNTSTMNSEKDNRNRLYDLEIAKTGANTLGTMLAGYGAKAPSGRGGGTSGFYGNLSNAMITPSSGNYGLGSPGKKV